MEEEKTFSKMQPAFCCKRKVSHRVYQELKADLKELNYFLLSGEPPKTCDSQKKVKVIISKTAAVSLSELVNKLENKVKISGYTDSFVFAELRFKELEEVEKLNEVDQIFLDEQVSGMLDCALQTTKACAVWRVFKCQGEGVIWAVVDTGINDRHPNFTPKSDSAQKPQKGSSPSCWDEKFFKDKEWFRQLNLENQINIEKIKDPDNTVILRIGFEKDNKDPHGTHIAGIIAGKNPNGKDFEGIAPRAKLLDFRVLDERRQGLTSSVIRALKIIKKINEEHNSIIIAGANLSLGYPFNLWDFGCGGSPLCQAVDELVHSGVIVVVAAGNEGYRQFSASALTEPIKPGEEGFLTNAPVNLYTFQSIADPGNARLAITVGSTHRRNPHYWGPSFFSSRGPTGDGRLKPDLLAPGEKIMSCEVNFDPNNEETHFSSMSGTSQAAAMVSGALALFLSINPEFTGRPLEVKEKLLAACTDLGRERYHQGHGLLDILRLVQSV